MSNAVLGNPYLGVGLHAIGAIFAAICYTPQKKVNRWSWQTYWLAQAAICWFVMPFIGAWLTIPELPQVLAEAPRGAMRNAFFLGMAYGIGGTAFGIAIRYIGFSLTYAIAIGLSSVLGTLVPPILNGTLGASFAKVGGSWILTGIIVGILGIALCGVAGRKKEKDLTDQATQEGFSLAKGLAVSLLSGVLAAFYGLALNAGQPIADVAARHGAGVWQGNVIYIFANTGAFLTTALYCLYLHVRHKTFKEFLSLPAGEERGSLPVNFWMAILTGVLWYGQFFFYNLGHVRMGHFKFTSWAIHMIMLVLFSNVVGIVLREWTSCRPQTRFILRAALTVLVAAVLLLTYGNRLGEMAAR